MRLTPISTLFFRLCGGGGCVSFFSSAGESTTPESGNQAAHPGSRNDHSDLKAALTEA